MSELFKELVVYFFRGGGGVFRAPPHLGIECHILRGLHTMKRGFELSVAIASHKC